MKTVPVAELKASLSAYLRRVKAGEDVLVTERGRPIARLTPAGTAGWPSHLESMEAQGLITAEPSRRQSAGRTAKPSAYAAPRSRPSKDTNSATVDSPPRHCRAAAS